MRRLRWVAVAVLATLTLVVSATAQEKAKTPAGTISGVVTIEGTAAEGVPVRLFLADVRSDDGVVAQTLTDKKGVFTLDGVAAGRYIVSPFAPGFASSESVYGRAGKLVSVGDRDAVEGIELDLQRGGVVTGRISDAEGQAVVSEDLQLLKVADDGTTTLIYLQTGTPTTDDRGIYRAFGLSPGKYLVYVGRETDPNQRHSMGFDPFIYPQTFYPGVSDQSRATPVVVTSGGEVRNVDIIVGKPVKTYKITGRVVDAETGEAVSRVGLNCGPVMEVNGTQRVSMMTGVMLGPGGRFEFDSLLPGDYGVMLGGGVSPYFADVLVVSVTNADVTGLEYKVSRGLSLSGVVVLEGSDDPAVRMQVGSLNLLASSPAAPTSLANTSKVARVHEDLSFEFSGLRAGDYVIGLLTWRGPKGFALLRVEHGGAPVDVVAVAPDQTVDNLRVVVGYGTGIVEGTVDFEQVPPPRPKYVGVTITRVDVKSGQGIPIQADERGRFVFDGLPPGDYTVRATVYDPSTRKPIYVGTSAVSVSNNQTSRVTVRLDRSEDERSAGE